MHQGARKLDFWEPLMPSWFQNGTQNHPSDAKHPKIQGRYTAFLDKLGLIGIQVRFGALLGVDLGWNFDECSSILVNFGTIVDGHFAPNFFKPPLSIHLSPISSLLQNHSG